MTCPKPLYQIPKIQSDITYLVDTWDPGGILPTTPALIPAVFHSSPLVQIPSSIDLVESTVTGEPTLGDLLHQDLSPIFPDPEIISVSWFGNTESILGRIRNLKDLVARADKPLYSHTDASLARNAPTPECNLVT